MSAFLCGKDHIDLLVTHAPKSWWYDERFIQREKSELGQLLVDENIASLRHRYRDGDWWATDDHWHSAYVFQPVISGVDPEQIIKACHCYAYQSCEHPEWSTSEAKAITDEIVREQTWKILDRVDDLQWEWSRESRVRV